MPLELLAYLPIYGLCKYISSALPADTLSKISEAVYTRLATMNDRDVKDYDQGIKRGLISNLQDLQKLQGMEDPKALRMLELDISLKLFKSNYLEKRIRGLNEMKEVIEDSSKYTGKMFYWTNQKSMDSGQIVEWLVQHKVLEMLTGDHAHAELIKRSTELFELLATKHKLTQENLTTLWLSLQGKHESYIRAVFDLIARMPSWLTTTETKTLFSLITSESPEMDEMHLNLLKSFSVTAINAECTRSRGEPGDYGAEKLFELVINECNEQALLSLLGLLTECKAPTKRRAYIEKAFYQFLQETAVPQTLELALELLSTFKDYEETELIRDLNKRLKLSSALTASINSYIEMTRDKNITEDCVTQDKTLHSKHLSTRFRLLDLLSRKGIKLDIANVEILWRALVVNPALGTDSSLLFRWITETVGNKGLNSEELQQVMAYFNDESLFTISNASVESFDAFARLFYAVNRFQGALEVRGLTIIKRLELKLVGFHTALSFVLDCDNKRVRAMAMSLVTECMVLLQGRLDKKETWLQFTSDLLPVMGEADSIRVNRALELCHALIDLRTDLVTSESSAPKLTLHISLPKRQPEKISVPNDVTLGYLRRKIATMLNTHHSKVRMRGYRTLDEAEDESNVQKVLGHSSYIIVEVVYNLIDEVKPSELLAIDSFYETLLRLAALPTSAELAWGLLMKLPFSRVLKRQLEHMDKSALEPPSRQSFHKSLYALLVIEELCQKVEYADRFLSSKEGQNLLKGVFEANVLTLECSGLLIVKFTEVVCVLVTKLLGKRLAVLETKRVLHQSINYLYCLSQKLVIGSQSAISEVSKLFDVCSNEDQGLFAAVLVAHPKLKEILLLILVQGEIVEARKALSDFIVHLSYPPFDLSQIFLQKLLELLLFALQEQRSMHYFATATALVKIAGVNFREVLVESRLQLLESLHSRAEKSSQDQDEALVGALRLIKSIVKTLNLTSTQAELEFVLKRCLLDMQPLCKHSESRKAALKLLKEMVARSPSSLVTLLPQLQGLYEDPRWRTGRLADWEISSDAGDRSSSGFVGVHNTGCICYMISVIQQLFMVRSFRAQILSLDISQHEQTEDNLLLVSQRIFAGLQYSKKQYISIKRLCDAWKDSSAVNVNEQMDVEEFLNAYMDKLEGKLGPHRSLIPNHFGGQLATEIIGKQACTHNSERVEQFLTLPIEVKNKKSLLESLESLVSGETLEGDNAYQCDKCEARVTAERRVGIRHLPNILLLALRRFDYNLDTMRRRKLNDYYEFPWELNLEPYTIEGLHRKDVAAELERARVEGRETTDSLPTKMFPDDYYQYRLRGVVIHMGSAEGGHYYCFIQDRETQKWLEFNDTMVREIDPGDIPAEAFGGEEQLNIPSYYGDVTEMQEKISSAYLLLYERVGVYAPRDPTDKEITELILPTDVPEAESIKTLIDKITESNLKFWRRKNAFAHEFVDFVLHLAKSQVADLPVFKLALSFFVTVVCRSKDRYKLQKFVPVLMEAIKTSIEASKWLLEMLSVAPVVQELLLTCPHSLIRRIIIGLVEPAIEQKKMKEAKVTALERVLSLLPLTKNSQHFTQYFELIYLLVKRRYRKINCLKLPIHIKIASWFIGYLKNEPAELQLQPQLSRDKDAYLGYFNFDPSPDHFRAVAPSRYPSITYLLLTLYEIELTKEQKQELLTVETLFVCLKQLEGKAGARAAGKLYSQLIVNDLLSSKQIAAALITSAQEGTKDYKKLCYRVLSRILQGKDSVTAERVDSILGDLATRMKTASNSREKTDVEFLGKYIFKSCLHNESALMWVTVNARLFSWVDEWIRRWTYPMHYLSDTLDHAVTRQLKMLSSGNVATKEEDWDSDEDINFEQNLHLRVYNVNTDIWEYVTVIDALGDVARGKMDTREGAIMWLERDGDDVRLNRY